MPDLKPVFAVSKGDIANLVVHRYAPKHRRRLAILAHADHHGHVLPRVNGNILAYADAAGHVAPALQLIAPLYVRRDVLNAEQIITWAKAQGFRTTLPAEDMHVTVVYSKALVDWNAMDHMVDEEEFPAGERRVMPLGEDGAWVLRFEAQPLTERHHYFRSRGASWDYADYHPHITLTYDAGDAALAAEPYRGVIRLGPEVFEEIQEGWADDIVEHAQRSGGVDYKQIKRDLDSLEQKSLDALRDALSDARDVLIRRVERHEGDFNTLARDLTLPNLPEIRRAMRRMLERAVTAGQRDARREIRAARAAVKEMGYNPDQPREPAGSSEGGQWASGGGGPDIVVSGHTRRTIKAQFQMKHDALSELNYLSTKFPVARQAFERGNIARIHISTDTGYSGTAIGTYYAEGVLKRGLTDPGVILPGVLQIRPYYRGAGGKLDADSTEPLIGGVAHAVGSSSVKDVLRHEIGHLVHHKVIQDGYLNKEWLAIHERLAGNRELVKTGRGWARGLNRISNYAETNSKESFAESFAAYVHPGYKRSSLPAEVEQFMDAHVGRRTFALADLIEEIKTAFSDLFKNLEITVGNTLPGAPSDECVASNEDAIFEQQKHVYADPPAFTPRAALRYLRSKEFWITDLLDSQITEKARGVLLDALKKGEPLGTTTEELWELFERYIGDPSVLRDGEPLRPSRLETIVRTNTTDAYNQGRLSEFLDPDMRLLMNGFRYSAVLDERTTPVCQFLDDKVFPPDSPAVQELVPPRHFNCRSILVPLIVGEEFDEEDIITDAEIGRAKDLSGEGFAEVQAEWKGYHRPDQERDERPRIHTYIVRHEGEEWVVRTRDGKKVLGRHKTKQDAAAQLRAIEANK